MVGLAVLCAYVEQHLETQREVGLGTAAERRPVRGGPRQCCGRGSVAPLAACVPRARLGAARAQSQRWRLPSRRALVRAGPPPSLARRASLARQPRVTVRHLVPPLSLQLESFIERSVATAGPISQNKIIHRENASSLIFV